MLVVGPVHFPHATGPDLFHNPVVPQYFAQHEVEPKSLLRILGASNRQVNATSDLRLIRGFQKALVISETKVAILTSNSTRHTRARLTALPDLWSIGRKMCGTPFPDFVCHTRMIAQKQLR
jgi:hypothetical protein